jgi:hypothetical protein
MASLAVIAKDILVGAREKRKHLNPSFYAGKGVEPAIHF